MSYAGRAIGDHTDKIGSTTFAAVGAGGSAPTRAAQALVATLAHVPLFAGLAPARLMEVATLVRRRRYRRGQVIIYQGDPADALYLIVSGEVKVSVLSPHGDETIFTLLGPDECFGELELFDDQPREATIETTRPTEVLRLERAAIRQLVERSPDVALALLGVLARRLRSTDRLVEDSAFLGVPERVAKTLGVLVAAYHRSESGGAPVELQLTQHDLAAMIGATRESVNKALSALRDRGVVALGRQRIVVADVAALEQA